MDPRHGGKMMRHEFQASLILQPLDAVIRLHDGVVERITIRHEDIEIAVTIEVDGLDAGGAPIRVWSFVQNDGLEAERGCALVDVCDDCFVLLRKQRDEIEFPVAVQIHRDHVDRARAGIDDVLHQRLVFEYGHAPDRAPAERRHRQIELPITVEISCADISHARPPLEDLLNIFAAGHRTHPDDGAIEMVAREQPAEVPDQESRVSVGVQVRHRNPGRVGNRGNHLER